MPDRRAIFYCIYTQSPLKLQVVCFSVSYLVPWYSRPYFTVSDLRLPISSALTSRMVTVEIFDPASTRVTASTPHLAYTFSGRTTWKTQLLHSCSPTAALLRICCVATGTCLPSRCPETALVYPPISQSLHRNSSTRCSTFRQTRHVRSSYHRIRWYLNKVGTNEQSDELVYIFLLSLQWLSCIVNWEVPSSNHNQNVGCCDLYESYCRPRSHELPWNMIRIGSPQCKNAVNS
jgi:hypothetical protein